MLSMPRLLPPASRSLICASSSCFRQLSTSISRPQHKPSLHLTTSSSATRLTLSSSQNPLSSLLKSTIQLSQRFYATKSSADHLVDELEEQYFTARDEFEIASEETEKKSVYAVDDRAAAREELNVLKEMFEKAIEGEDGQEIRKRVGQRIRELDQAVQALEKSALGE